MFTEIHTGLADKATEMSGRLRPALARCKMAALLMLLMGLSLPAQALEAVQHWQTENGARVYFMPAPELPMADVRVVFDAGSARDGEKAGLARLTHALMTEGTADMSAQQVAATFDGVGARIDGASLRDMAYLGLRTLTSPPEYEAAVKMFARLLAEPAFTESAFERERARMLQALKAESQSPARVASKTFYRALYGDHPYATPPGGDAQSLSALEIGAVRDFYRRHYVARNAVIAIVGALQREQAEVLAERVSAGLAKGKRAQALPEVQMPEAGREIRIPFPSSQAHIFVGQPGLSRKDPDYHALYMANHILGGSGFSSRLMEEIREQRGLAYSVYSYFLPMAEEGPFMMGMQTRIEQVDQSVALLHDNLRRFLAEGPSDEEVAHARKNITGSFPLRVSSNAKLLDYLALIGFYDLPLDYLARFNERIEALDKRDLHQAMRARLQPQRMVTVIVGGEGEPGHE